MNTDILIVSFFFLFSFHALVLNLLFFSSYLFYFSGAVARIPRVAGSGTHRAGQAAFGNMCRGGRMYSPTKVWRKWHVKVNVSQRRFALASALAASALPALVMARGHKVGKVPELPLVVSDAAEAAAKTKDAKAILKALGAVRDVEKAEHSKRIRTGKGKSRNRRYVSRKGPLVVYAKDEGITRAFRNLAGVNLCEVTRLNLLELAPGGHVGRFIVWTAGAFNKLDALYGTAKVGAKLKKNYHLPKPKLANPDLARIINSDEIQSVVRAAKKPIRFVPHKKNPLVNHNALIKLNPYAAVAVRAGRAQEAKAKHVVAKAPKKLRKGSKAKAAKKVDPKVAAKTKANAKKFLKKRTAAKNAFYGALLQ